MSNKNFNNRIKSRLRIISYAIKDAPRKLDMWNKWHPINRTRMPLTKIGAITRTINIYLKEKK